MTVEQTAEAIRTMDVRGAAAIARAAAAAMAGLAGSWSGEDPEEFMDALAGARQTLLDTRPTAVSLRNALNASMKDVAASDGVEGMRKKVSGNAAAFIQGAKSAGALIASMCARRIRPGSTLMTHCNSAMALGGIMEAHRQGKDIHVYATESRPRRQGHISARQLADAGLSVTLIVDSAVRHHMARTDMVVVGADAIASNGAVINKIGTSQLALAAREARIPVTVCAESYKFSPLTLYGELVEIEERDPSEVVSAQDLPGVRISNPVFDATPPEYIDVIVTELGVIPPSAAYEMIVARFGYEALKALD